MRPSLNVLMVDQAITFGGSIVVMANIANNFPSNVLCSVIYEVNNDIADTFFSEHVRKRSVRNMLDYRTAGQMSAWIHSFKLKVFKVLCFKLLAMGKIVANILQVIRISRIILVDRIDIVHSNNSNAAIIAAKLLRKKVILHLHGIGSYEKDRLREKVDGYISISKFVSNQAIIKGYSKNKITLLPNPVLDVKIDTVRSNFFRKKFNIGDSDKVLGVVGRIIDWKGQLEFLDAAGIVMEKMDGVKVLIIGDISDGTEEYLEKVKNKITKLGITDKVILTGYISDIHNVMANLDLLVHCSILPEPFGLVITEAMSLGIPVVASDKGAPPEIVKIGETGFIVDPNDKDQMASYILNILGNDELARIMGNKAKDDVFENYNIKNYMNSLTNKYENLLGICK